MTGMSWFACALFAFVVLAYQRASLIVWTISYAILLVFATTHIGLTFVVSLCWLIFFAITLPLSIAPIRQRFLTLPILSIFRKVMPSMSRTEREAIDAGSITWEGDLFAGNPDWFKLQALKAPRLSAEEQAFMDGPVDTLCEMLDDWDITHNRADLPPEVWQYIKDRGFFSLIIPKRYGGKEFSAYAHSQMLVKVSGRSTTASTTIAVPNSLGPAELILQYGTEEQKNYYLPRLATGEEIPCFALTSPDAGSDASAMTDYGIVCYENFQGNKTLGIRLNFNKRYITLAPIATVIGLAFKLHDPDHLLGNEEDIGITCALIPRKTPGITIGRRHFPVNIPFQNGPLQGKNVFIPLDWIIGGKDKAGKGWGMLMECLAAGRAITLPSSALGGAKALSYCAGAYARIRKQFGVSIGKFEGIEEPLARIAGYTYIMDGARSLAVASIDDGEKPSVASAIIKYHVTELGRKVICDGLDIHGGKGICLGPKNFVARGYEAIPIAITVEGANILTRNMIIFGQGAMRCHPYVLAEMEAAMSEDKAASLVAFDKAIYKHVAFGISNVVRSLVLGLTGSYIVRVPSSKLRRYYQYATRFSSAFALCADTAMLCLGGGLKRKESISARLGDILSYLYLLSSVLKLYHEQGEPAEDLPVAEYACQYCLYKLQEGFAGTIKNFPNRIAAFILSLLIFPLGRNFSRPSDKLSHEVAQLLIGPTATRDRLAAGSYLRADKGNYLAEVQDALLKSIAAEPIEKMIKIGIQDGVVEGHSMHDYAVSALNKKLITDEQFDLYLQAEAARNIIIAVDDFSPEELARSVVIQTSDNSYARNDKTHL